MVEQRGVWRAGLGRAGAATRGSWCWKVGQAEGTWFGARVLTSLSNTSCVLGTVPGAGDTGYSY